MCVSECAYITCPCPYREEPLSILYMGSNNSSSRMDDSDSRSRSDEGSDQETDLATILQYLIRRYTYVHAHQSFVIH